MLVGHVRCSWCEARNLW
ncbi:MAG TPA: hypothetical protein DE314_01930 [Sulfitobacter sp.]|nr:hypothetical protein [Sulfitobacter sp.]